MTQPFTLGRAMPEARTIRISDKSGRVRDANQKPLATPGVSIRGVGVALVR